jgi:hypothetical protein
MTSRKEVLQPGIATSAMAILPQLSLGSTAFAEPSQALYKVIHDTRFHDSLRLSQQLLSGFSEAGHDLLQPVVDNVTPFWFHQLSREWEHSATALYVGRQTLDVLPRGLGPMV